MSSGQQSSSVRVSVVIPCRNAVAYLPEALDSVFAQSRPPSEILVVDNCSTDGTESLIRRLYSDHLGKGGLHYLRNDQDRGVVFSRNRGVGAARGELVAFLDADDKWRPNHLELVTDHFHKSEHLDAVLVPPSTLIDAGGREIGYVGFDGDRWSVLEAVVMMKAVCPTGLIVRRDAYLAAGGMEELEEILFLFKLVASGRALEFLTAGTTLRRVHGGQTMAKSVNERSTAFLRELDSAYGRILVHDVVKRMRPAAVAQAYIGLSDHHVFRGSMAQGRAYLLNAFRRHPPSCVSLRAAKLLIRSLLPARVCGLLRRVRSSLAPIRGGDSEPTHDRASKKSLAG